MLSTVCFETQRFGEPLHADHGSEYSCRSNRIPAPHRLPQKWTLAQPRNLLRIREKVLRRPVHAVDPAADRDNFRDNQAEIGSLVTRMLTYT